MNIEELKRLAEAATPDQWIEGDGYAGISVGKRPIVQAYGESRKEAIGNMRYILAAQPSAVLELIRQRDELLAALKDAREMVSDWAGYASPYFQEKHDIDGDLKKLDDAITKAEVTT